MNYLDLSVSAPLSNFRFYIMYNIMRMGNYTKNYDLFILFMKYVLH